MNQMLCRTTPIVIDPVVSNKTPTNSFLRFSAPKPAPTTNPAIALSIVCPKNQPNIKIGLAVVMESRPKTSDPQISAPSFKPKMQPSGQVLIPNLPKSHTSITVDMRNERYPNGIKKNARSGGSKNGLGLA